MCSVAFSCSQTPNFAHLLFNPGLYPYHQPITKHIRYGSVQAWTMHGKNGTSSYNNSGLCNAKRSIGIGAWQKGGIHAYKSNECMVFCNQHCTIATSVYQLSKTPERILRCRGLIECAGRHMPTRPYETNEESALHNVR